MTTDLQKPEPFTAPAILPIKTTEQYQFYAQRLLDIKGYCQRVVAFFKPHKEGARAVWQGLLDEEKKALSPAIAAEAAIKSELALFQAAQERLRLLEERRLAEEARKAQEARILEEAAAMELEADRTGDEDLRQQAEELAAEPTVTPAVSLQSFVPKVSGITQRGSYSARCTDLKKLVAYVLKHPTNINLLMVNQTALNALARSQKENLKIPGVQLVKGSIIGASAR